jgi:hypothetical protein
MEEEQMHQQRIGWAVFLGVSLFAAWPAHAQDRSTWPQIQEKSAPLTQVVAPVTIPAEWGALRDVLPLPGNPGSYAVFLEDSAGNIRIVPLHLTLIGGGWQYTPTRDPAVIIRRGP